MNLRGRILIIVLIITVNCIVLAAGTEPAFVKYKTDKWVNGQLDRMTLEEKIAQLMTISVYPEHGADDKNKIVEQIKTFAPGGILVMQGAPVKTAKFINELQQKSKIPLLVATDAEWGLSMRIDSVMKFPYAQAIGAVQDSSSIYQMGRDFGAQLKLMGIHMNFAPVADINTNPSNPVINFRSFGEDKINVAQKAWWIAEGMHDAGIIAVAKHFPGHGDTDTDSHKTLPFLNHSKKRMDSVETFPFRYLSERGIAGIMTAHLNVPSIDNSGTPSSLSKKIVTGYLKNEIGFKGFVVTDAINMKGARTGKGNAEAEALIAGNDIIEFVPDLQKAIQSVKNAINSGKLSVAEIDEKCKTVLALKYWANLNNYKAAETNNLTARLNSPYLEVTNRKLIKGSLTVLKNNGILPVQGLDTLKIASLFVGSNEISPFESMLDKYARIDHFYLPKNASLQEWSTIHAKLKKYNLVICGIQGINIYPSGKYGTTEIQRKAVAEVISEKKTVAVFFGNAYALKYFENIHQAKGLIVAYQNSDLAKELSAQLVFGAFDGSGKLPVTVDGRFRLNDGIFLRKNGSLAYTIPEELEINSGLLNHVIDSLVILGLTQGAYPGAQVLVARNGSVIFHKTYGFHSLDNKLKVKETDIYDWASISKVTGALPAIMKLVDDGKLKIDSPIGLYRNDLAGSDKENLIMRDILAHQAGLVGWINFWEKALNDKKELDRNIFSEHPSDKFKIRVSSRLYMNSDFSKVMFDSIKNSKLNRTKKYVYSDLGFHLFPGLISNLTGEQYEEYLDQMFYKPLGAESVGFNPYKRFPPDRLIPTEKDDYFRHEVVLGFVHDEGAAMMGGISGNAGLFGTTNDLAKIFQMYLQKGFYGGKRYISEETIDEFTRIQFPENDNRRGLGFDKPLIDNYKNSLKDAYPAIDASKNSYGHSGFTGTFAWADPDNGLLFLFMTNRVNPTRNNAKITSLNLRTAMHQKIYDCIKTGIN